MVTVRQIAEFQTTIPAHTTETGPEQEFGGRAFAEAIADVVRSLGYEVAPPKFADEHGWELDAEAPQGRFWLQVTNMSRGNVMLQTENVGWGMFRSPYDHADFLVSLDAALRADPRFSDLRWATDKECADNCWSTAPVDD